MRLLKLPGLPGKDAADALGLAIIPCPCRRVVRGAWPRRRRWRRAPHAQYRKRQNLLTREEDPDERTRQHVLDHLHRHAGSFDAYLALPPAGRGPGLLLLQEIFGVNEHIRTRGRAVRAGRLRGAGAGRLLAAAAPPRDRLHGDDIQRGRALAMAADRDALARPGRLRCAALRARPEVRAAASAPSATAWAGAWPMWPRPRPASTPRWPTTAAASRTCWTWRRRSPARCSSTTARSTTNIPLSAVDKVRAAMPGGKAEMHVYDNADHGFNCWARGSYHAASAALAHGRALQFLASELF